MTQTRFMRWASVVGDLGSPFYLEERQRDVWNEASAVGLQTMIWLLLAAATAALWIGGQPALPYAAVMSVIGGVGSMVTVAYAQRLGVAAVQPGMGRWLSRRRLALVAVLYVLFLGGLVRATWGLAPESVRHGFWVGLPLGLVMVVVLGVRALRKAERAEADAAV